MTLNFTLNKDNLLAQKLSNALRRSESKQLIKVIFQNLKISRCRIHISIDVYIAVTLTCKP